MLREPEPTDGGPPLDHVPEPAKLGPHPIKRGLGAFLIAVGVGVVLYFSLFIAVALIAGFAYWEALSWCFEWGADE